MRFLQMGCPLDKILSRYFAALHHIPLRRRIAGNGRPPGDGTHNAGLSDVMRAEMHELLPGGGIVRKLWVGEADAYRDHLLRLDPESRHRRFSGSVADEVVVRHAATVSAVGVVVHGFFVDGVLRGAAELRHIGSPLAAAAGGALRPETP